PPSRYLARAVAELRPRAGVRDVAGDRPPSVRPRRHTLRSREQLRAALWSAEETFGRLLATELAPYRDELVVSTKAGTRCGPAPTAITARARPAREPRLEPAPARARVRRHLLLASGRSRHAARGD